MREQTITIRADRCTLCINLPIFFQESTQASIVKALKLLFTNSWEQDNTETIVVLDDYLPELVLDMKVAWEEASREFQREYKDPNRYTRKERPAIREKNDSLYGQVKSAKREHDKAVKNVEVYTATKEKYL